VEGGSLDVTTKQAVMETSTLHGGGNHVRAGITMYPTHPSPSHGAPAAWTPQIPAVWGLWLEMWPWRSKHPWEVCTRL